MNISGIIAEQLNSLQPLVRELFTGTKQDWHSGPTVQLKKLGDNLINFAALLNCNIYLENISDNKLEGSFIGYIKDFLNDDRGVDLGPAMCIQLEILKQPELYTEHAKFTIDGHLLNRWVELRKRIRGTKRVKKLTIEIKPEIIDLVNDFLSNFKFIDGLKIDDNQNWVVTDLESSISLFPFFLIHRCEICQNEHLFAFDRFSPTTDEYNFMCWGNNHYLTINNEDIKVLPQLNELKKKIGLIKNEQTHQTSYLSLIATSYPTMHRLVDLLFEQTQLENQKELWANKSSKKIKLNTQEDLIKHHDFLKNLILIDCVEEGPISIIRKVARVEGSTELPGYLRILLSKKHKTEEAIEREISDFDNKCKQVIKERGVLIDREKRDIKDEIYSIEVAKLLGFPVSDLSNIHNLEYFISKIDERIRKVEYNKSEEDSSYEHELFDSLKELEEIYRELVFFYKYIFKKEIQTSAKTEQGIEFNDNRKGFGLLNEELREINKLFINNVDKTNDLWGDRQIFNYRDYSKLVKEGNKHGDLFKLRNELGHIATFFAAKRDHFSDCCKKDRCIEYLRWIRDVMSFFANSRDRIYPYKITITVLSATHHGIQTCQYVTDLTNIGREYDESINEGTQTKIYTEHPVDFTKIYYCLPHRRRATENLWVDPLLIPIDEVGYK